MLTDTEDLEKDSEGCDRPLVTGPVSSSEKWTLAIMMPFLGGENSKASSFTLGATSSPRETGGLSCSLGTGFWDLGGTINVGVE